MIPKSTLILGLLLAALPGWSPAQGESEPLPYIEPDFSTPLFQLEGFIMERDAKEQLHYALLRLARLPELDGLTRGKVMALAHTLFPGDREIILTDYKLRFSGKLEDPPGSAPETRESLHSKLSTVQTAYSLPSTGNFGQSRMRISRYLADIGGSLMDSETIEPQRRSLQRADWSNAFREGTKVMEVVAGNGTPPLRAFITEASSVLTSYPKRQSLIKGLLVAQLQGSQVAGEASQMNATVLPVADGGPTMVSFNQEVGSDMEQALDRALILLALKHDGFPPGHRIEISFEEQYSGKDGPSAAVACALLLESLITGQDLDPGFAVTGDLSVEGKVKAVGGIDGKIRGASHRHCTHVAIPHVTRTALTDLLLTDGVDPFIRIQVFTIENYEEALALATPSGARDPKIEESLKLFASIQEVLSQPNGARLLGNPQVRERLANVVELTPNHASARLLLLKGTNQEPKSLSIGGSLAAIDQAVLPLIQALQSRKNNQSTRDSPLETDQITDAIYNLKRIRGKLDQRTWDIVDSMGDFSDLLRTLKTNPPGSFDRRRALLDEIVESGSRISMAYQRLSNDPAIKRELEGE